MPRKVNGTKARPLRATHPSLICIGRTVPIALLNPWLASGLFVDYLAHSRYPPVPKSVQFLAPCDLSRLTVPSEAPQNAASAGVQAPRSVAGAGSELQALEAANFGLEEMKDSHE